VEGVLQLAHPLEEQERLYGGLIGALLTLIPLALLVAGLGGAFLTGHALRPVRQLQEAAAQISAEDLSRRLEVPGKDEFSELAATFNGMVARLEAAFRSLEAAYQQQRRFVGDASHELRTPLTVVKANTSLALSGQRTAADYREALQAVDGAADMMSRIVQDLLLLARSDSGRLGLEPRPVELGPLLRQAAASVPNPHAVPILLDLPATPCQAHGDSHHLTRLFVNLLENAVRHTPPEGRIAVAARYGTDAAEGTGSPFLTVSVQDTGEGIPAEHLPHVCERFYRVDAARSHAGYAGQGSGGAGAGLGLAICQSIVQAHGGVLSIESEEGRGTTVWVTLPCGGASVARAPQPVLASNA
jgi:signal transduction histidine kinase